MSNAGQGYGSASHYCGSGLGFSLECGSDFHFHADSDPAPSSKWCESETYSQTLQGSILSLHATIVSVHDPQWLYFEPPKLLVPDPNPQFHSTADPDPAAKNNADPDPQSCHKVYRFLCNRTATGFHSTLQASVRRVSPSCRSGVLQVITYLHTCRTTISENCFYN